jgi:hypothetical protein
LIILVHPYLLDVSFFILAWYFPDIPHVMPPYAARTPELEADFKKREMQFMVFDDSAGDDSERSVIGIAFVPLNDLARGVPVEGTFNLVNPLTRQKAGQIVLGLGWHNPLRLPGELPSGG